MNFGPVRVSLTYDGTTKNHLELVVPLLQKYGFLATFFVDAPNLLEHFRAWQEVAKMGHELGNGCLLNAANPDGTLPLWTSEMIAADVEENDQLIRELGLNDGVIPFAYPSGVAFLEDRCPVGRLLNDEMNFAGDINLRRLSSYRYAQRCLPKIKADLVMNQTKGCWAIFAFDEICPIGHEEVLNWISKDGVKPLLLARCSGADGEGGWG